MICPKENGSEAAWAGDGNILAPSSLLSLINHFKGTQVISPPQPHMLKTPHHGPDLKEVKGQMLAKRALEIAAAGGHNMLMIGPPGAGKSMLAACMPSILPDLTPEEILEVSTIASIAGRLPDGKLTNARPYRDPHHSSSMAAMVGGGRRAVPGEISLAHHGILFLDELAEFPRGVLESLRQPLETGKVSVARAQAHVTYPANVQLIAAMNPCRCGYLDDPAQACSRAPKCAVDYQAKLSGPLLDRIDIHVEVPKVDTLSMINDVQGESSEVVAKRVKMARDKQVERYADIRYARTNADASGEYLQEVARLTPDAKALLETVTQNFSLSMRGYTRVLRVSRTVADIDGSDIVEASHVAEAASYRPMQYGREQERA